MRSPRVHFWLVFAALLTACSDAELPTLGRPIAVETPADGNVAGPRFSTGPDGQLVLSWMARTEAMTTLRYSPLVGGRFFTATDVVAEPRMFVNWADLPSVMPVSENHWIAHWLRYSADKTYSYDVVVSQSFDAGKIWSDPITAHTDGTPTEHGFVSIAPDVDGAALLWLDGRHTPDASMTLRSAVITKDGRRIREQEVDDSVCDCCQTDIGLTTSGPIAVYRDRTDDEIRDIYVTRLVNGRWQPGVRLLADDWKIAACPVNGPSIATDGEHVAVAWFSAANDYPVVRLVRSSDGGVTFEAPLDIAAGRINGYAGLVALGRGGFGVSWVAKGSAGNNLLQVRLVSVESRLGPAVTVATIDQLRVFPQLAYQDGQLLLAWTDGDSKQRELFAARVPIAQP